MSDSHDDFQSPLLDILYHICVFVLMIIIYIFLINYINKSGIQFKELAYLKLKEQVQHPIYNIPPYRADESTEYTEKENDDSNMIPNRYSVENK